MVWFIKQDARLSEKSDRNTMQADARLGTSVLRCNRDAHYNITLRDDAMQQWNSVMCLKCYSSKHADYHKSWKLQTNPYPTCKKLTRWDRRGAKLRFSKDPSLSSVVLGDLFLLSWLWSSSLLLFSPLLAGELFSVQSEAVKSWM